MNVAKSSLLCSDAAGQQRAAESYVTHCLLFFVLNKTLFINAESQNTVSEGIYSIWTFTQLLLVLHTKYSVTYCNVITVL